MDSINTGYTEGEQFARQCDVTGEGMNEGFCFDDIHYFKYEKDAAAHAKKQGYKNLQQAFDDEAYYYTEWYDKEDMEYIVINGKLEPLNPH
jgi:hypothetical protein